MTEEDEEVLRAAATTTMCVALTEQLPCLADLEVARKRVRDRGADGWELLDTMFEGAIKMRELLEDRV